MSKAISISQIFRYFIVCDRAFPLVKVKNTNSLGERFINHLYQFFSRDSFQHRIDGTDTRGMTYIFIPATPRIFIHMFTQSASYRVLMNISKQCYEICFIFNWLTLKSVLEQMPEVLILLIVIERIGGSYTLYYI